MEQWKREHSRRDTHVSVYLSVPQRERIQERALYLGCNSVSEYVFRCISEEFERDGENLLEENRPVYSDKDDEMVPKRIVVRMTKKEMDHLNQLVAYHGFKGCGRLLRYYVEKEMKELNEGC